jgi:ketosteroid isomerase-like protein
MKTFFISLFAILIIGCTSQAPKPMTDSEKEAIKSEVKKEFTAMVEACMKVDLQTALSYYWDSPDFKGFGVDGELIDYATFKKANEEFFNAVQTLQFLSIKEDIKVLASDLAIFIWQYKAEIDLKTGEKMNFDKIGVTYLYKKIDGVWKIVYYHESALPPIVAEAKK